MENITQISWLRSLENFYLSVQFPHWSMKSRKYCICEELWNFPGEGNGTPLQYSYLENPTDGGAWWATVHGVAKSQTQLSDLTFTFHFYALEKEMATHSSVLAWRIPGTGGAWWAAVYGVAQSRTQLKRLSSSSSSTLQNIVLLLPCYSKVISNWVL